MLFHNICTVLISMLAHNVHCRHSMVDIFNNNKSISINLLSWLKRYGASAKQMHPTVDFTLPEMAIRHGYSAETHTVLTADGYFLTMHRIPCGKNGCTTQSGRGRGQPVYLLHGIICSSAIWLISVPEKALAYKLADEGYDVWLGNVRGNSYSRHHITYHDKDKKYWDFSWHEMGVFDIPAQIDYIYNIKNNSNTTSNSTLNNLIFIGHSMGATILFVMLAERPEYNQKIRVALTLAPIGYMKHIKTPARLFTPHTKDFMFIRRLIGAPVFFPHTKIPKFAVKYWPVFAEINQFVYEVIVTFIAGYNNVQFDKTVLPEFLQHLPAGTSTKTVTHYAQELDNDGKFQKYDYGKERNLKEYGQDYPPLYNVSGITTPIALFYTNNDWLATPTDVTLLNKDLPTSTMHKVGDENFSHMDYVLGIDAPTMVNVPVMKLIARYR